MRHHLLATLVFGLFASFGTACSDAETNGGAGESRPTGSGTTTTLASNCEGRCATKTAQCGATSAEAASICSSVCAKSPSEGEMQCLEVEACDDPSAMEKRCGVGRTVASPPATSTSSPSPSNPPSTKTQCLDKQGQAAVGYERYACQCNKGLEVKGCSTSSQQACKSLCGSSCTASSRCSLE